MMMQNTKLRLQRFVKYYEAFCRLVHKENETMLRNNGIFEFDISLIWNASDTCV